MPEGVTITALVRVDDLRAWAAAHDLGQLSDLELVHEIEERVIRAVNATSGGQLRVTEIGHTRWRTP